MTETDPAPADLRETLARSLYEHDGADPAEAPADGATRDSPHDTDRDTAREPPWDDRLDANRPGLRDRYRARADAILRGPLATLPPADPDARWAEARDELRVLRRQRMAPERERELLEANNRMLDRVRAAEAARDAAETAHGAARADLAAVRRERDAAREAEAFWQQFAFDADELATARLVELADARAAAERTAIRERAWRERAEGALRLFADRADVMPKEGWVSDLAGMNRDIPLWWFHAARVALDRHDPPSDRRERTRDAAGAPVQGGAD